MIFNKNAADGSRLSQLQFTLLMFSVFVAVTLFGMIMHENIRKAEAKSLGYESSYEKEWGQLFFSNEEIQPALNAIIEANPDAIRSGADFEGKDKWDALACRDRKDKAMIELSGLIFTFSVSIIGLIILLLRRKKNKLHFGLPDWAGIILSLFILKEFIFSLIYFLHGGMPCNHAKMFEYFNLHVWFSSLVLLLYSFLFALFMLIKFVPRNRAIPFILAGISGGITGIMLWLLFLGRMVFPY